MADYTPTLFYKGNLVETVDTWREHYELLYDGWTPNGPAPVPDPNYEDFITRTGSVAGQVPVLQADGTLNLETQAGSDVNVAGYINDVASSTRAALSAAYTARYTRIDVVADHGADNTGVTSAVTAFEAALAAANTAAGKVEIIVPPGTYDLTAGLSTVITNNHVHIVGGALGTTTIKVTTGTLFQWGNGTGSVFGGGMTNVSLVGLTPAANQQVVKINGGSAQKFSRIIMDNVRQLASLGVVGAGTSSGASFRHVYGNTDPTAGSVVIDAVYGYSLSLNDVVVNAKGVGFPVDGTTLHPAADTTFLRFGQGTWDTAHCYEVVTNRYNRGLDLNCETAVNLVNLWFYGCVFDYSKTSGVRIRTNHAGCNIRSIFFSGGWAVASDAHSVEISCTLGTMRSISFSQFTARQAGKNNWRISGGGSVEGVTLTDCRGMGANRLSAANTGSDQDDMVILGSGVNVVGGRFGEDGQSYTGITPNQGRYGITVAAEVDVYGITNVTSDGVTGAFQLPATNSAGSRRRLVTNNRRGTADTALNYATTSAPAVPGSGATQTHTGATIDTLYIYGGTVTAITHNGTTVCDTTGCTLTLRPGDTWSVTYSVAPTIKRVVAA